MHVQVNVARSNCDDQGQVVLPNAVGIQTQRDTSSHEVHYWHHAVIRVVSWESEVGVHWRCVFWCLQNILGQNWPSMGWCEKNQNVWKMCSNWKSVGWWGVECNTVVDVGKCDPKCSWCYDLSECLITVWEAGGASPCLWMAACGNWDYSSGEQM